MNKCKNCGGDNNNNGTKFCSKKCCQKSLEEIAFGVESTGKK